MLNKRSIVITSAWAASVLLIALLYQLGFGNLQSASLLLVVGALGITAVNWHEHRGGRSPAFIFLVLGCVFLCGRAFPVLLGEESQLARITFNEVSVGTDTVMTYVLLVLSSFFFVHIGSLLTAAKKVELSPSRIDAKIYWVFFLLLLPMYLYKNLYYFKYIMDSGGYLAIYQGTDHLEGVGTVVRIGALLTLAAFTLYFFHETDQRKSRLALILFVVIFASELLVGLRGKFFVITLVFFLFYKLRFGGEFSVRGLLTLLAAIVVIAVVVEVAREQVQNGYRTRTFAAWPLIP